MTRRTTGFLLAILLLPAIANYGAHRGYFEDDDLDTLTWARQVPLKDLVFDLPSLKYPPNHSRPTGYFYYGALFRTVNFNYGPWVTTLQSIGLLNAALLWLLLRKIGFDEFAAAAGCFFFVINRALFDAWWKPMFVYDVLCTTFALGSVLAYAYRKWVFSFIAFWIAMRTKEVGVALPAVLLGYEMTIGSRQWKRVLPFLLPAAVYGGYGLWYDLGLRSNHVYGIHFAPSGMWKSLSFYSSKVFYLPYAGFLLPLALFRIRDRRLYFAICAMACQLAIYILLPGRLLEVYLYLAMTSAAIAIAVFMTHYQRVTLVLALAWIPWQAILLRRQARLTLTDAAERRAYVSALRSVPDASIYIYADAPASLRSWGVEGALRLFHDGIASVHPLEDERLPLGKPMEALTWESSRLLLHASVFSPLENTFLAKEATPAAWQVAYPGQRDESGYRRIPKTMKARLYRPANADQFSWEACGDRGGELRAFVGGEEIPRLVFTEPGCITRIASVGGNRARVVNIDFLVEPPEKTAKIGSFGFPNR